MLNNITEDKLCAFVEYFHIQLCNQIKQYDVMLVYI